MVTFLHCLQSNSDFKNDHQLTNTCPTAQTDFGNSGNPENFFKISLGEMLGIISKEIILNSEVNLRYSILVRQHTELHNQHNMVY